MQGSVSYIEAKVRRKSGRHPQALPPCPTRRMVTLCQEPSTEVQPSGQAPAVPSQHAWCLQWFPGRGEGGGPELRTIIHNSSDFVISPWSYPNVNSPKTYTSVKGVLLPEKPGTWEPGVDQPLRQCLGSKQYQQEILNILLSGHQVTRGGP